MGAPSSLASCKSGFKTTQFPERKGNLRDLLRADTGSDPLRPARSKPRIKLGLKPGIPKNPPQLLSTNRAGRCLWPNMRFLFFSRCVREVALNTATTTTQRAPSPLLSLHGPPRVKAPKPIILRQGQLHTRRRHQGAGWVGPRRLLRKSRNTVTRAPCPRGPPGPFVFISLQVVVLSSFLLGT